MFSVQEKTKIHEKGSL